MSLIRGKFSSKRFVCISRGTDKKEPTRGGLKLLNVNFIFPSFKNICVNTFKHKSKETRRSLVYKSAKLEVFSISKNLSNSEIINKYAKLEKSAKR